MWYVWHGYNSALLVLSAAHCLCYYVLSFLHTAIDLIGKMLQVARKNRFKTAQALNHIWLRVSAWVQGSVGRVLVSGMGGGGGGRVSSGPVRVGGGE